MKLEQLLSQRSLVHQSPSAYDIRARAKSLSPEPIKVFYGETYDHTGNTIDSMKYYFFVARLAYVLQQEGFNVDPVILIADTAACRNVSAEQENRYMRLGEARVQFVQEVNRIYGTQLKIVKMSDYINSEEFKKSRDEIILLCQQDKELMDKVEKTVPESKVDLEREKGFMYSFDEITTILDLDVKIGPPREDLYDSLAREIARKQGKKELMSLYLTPTFPLGKKWDYFFAHEGIEKHGITAYKGGSKRLQAHRIFVGKTDQASAAQLINDSFISKNSMLPNPVLDLGIIVDMARHHLQGEPRIIDLPERFYEGNTSLEELKEQVFHSLEQWILSKF